jgi:hypothetical protein
MEPVPGLQSYLALFLFPILAIILFQRLPVQKAVIWTVVSGYLFLPTAVFVSIDLPILPSFDKLLIPSFMAALLSVLFLRGIKAQNVIAERRGGEARPLPVVLEGWLPVSFIGLGLLGLMVVGTVLSVLTNGDTVVYGDRVLPAQRPFDAVSALLDMAIILLPLILGRKFLADDAGQKTLMMVIAAGALVYSLLALYEVRMSPQINNMVYGFFPHSFAQHIRGGGFRPLVFLDHGLQLGIFFACAILSIAVLMRLSDGVVRMRYLLALIYMIGVLFLSKTLGAFLITLVLLPVALLMPVRMQLLAAAVVAGITMAYPILRGAHVIPTDQIVELAERIDTNRAQSLAFRFHHEENLIDKAAERPVFGWSTWGRWRIYDETGRDITVSDGEWVITISQRGWVGYIAEFGLLCLPLMLFALRRRYYEVGLATSGLCLVVAANLIDLLPNATPSPIIWMAAGALLGRLEYKRAASEATDPAAPEAKSGTDIGSRDLGARGLQTARTAPQIPESDATSPYTRFPHQHRRDT